jgi:anti-sigma regulatory factor (Ser/Thr protein kinase)
MGATATISHGKRDVRLKIKAVPEAASKARAYAETMLTGWALRHLIEDAKLIVSELISNAVVATPDRDIWVLLVREHDGVWICVWDSSPELPEVRAYEPDAESGRGLHIVAAIAAENGAFRVAEPKGKLTWARLTI